METLGLVHSRAMETFLQNFPVVPDMDLCNKPEGSTETNLLESCRFYDYGCNMKLEG